MSDNEQNGRGGKSDIEEIQNKYSNLVGWGDLLESYQDVCLAEMGL